jgi:hypothetical protein
MRFAKKLASAGARHTVAESGSLTAQLQCEQSLVTTKPLTRLIENAVQVIGITTQRTLAIAAPNADVLRVLPDPAFEREWVLFARPGAGLPLEDVAGESPSPFGVVGWGDVGEVGVDTSLSRSAISASSCSSLFLITSSSSSLGRGRVGSAAAVSLTSELTKLPSASLPWLLATLAMDRAFGRGGLVAWTVPLSIA